MSHKDMNATLMTFYNIIRIYQLGVVLHQGPVKDLILINPIKIQSLITSG
jgi:hypothetical protein